jgi:hypothetical protein
MVESMNEYILIAISLVSWSLAAIFDSERDTIQYKPFKAWSSSKWWLGENYLIRKLLAKSAGQYRWFIKPLYYLVKYPFSFLNNGWHLCKSTSLVFLILPLAIINPYLDWFWFVIAFYIYYGIVFNLSYDY